MARRSNNNNFRTNTSLPIDQVSSNTRDPRLIQATRENAILRQEYLKKYPWATDWSLENLKQFENNATPVRINGVLRTPITYKPRTSVISSNTKTEYQHKSGQQAAKRELEKYKQLEETAQASEVINHPYNPIGWVPGLRTLFNTGADQQYYRYTGQITTPYTLPAAMSTGVDALTLSFGIGPMSNYAGAYTGTVAGGLIGEQFDQPYLGEIAGGIAGGFSPYAYKTFTDRFFIVNPNSYTRGIGRGTEGLEDLIKTGIVRGNPRGTEVTAKSFGKLFRKNRHHFREIMEATGIPNIENKYFSRTLTEKEFNAIKAVSKNYTTRKLINDGNSIVFTNNASADPLQEYNTYSDYLKIIQRDIDKVEQMPSRIASGEVKVNLEGNQPIEERFATNSDYIADGTPLSYWYSDGRNPFRKGHDYAGSNYGVRVNNPETYEPFIHTLHLHPSFKFAPKLSDPNVEVFKRLPFGFGWKLDKEKLLSSIYK